MPKLKNAKKHRLPRALIHIENVDKKFHEKWDEDRDPLNFPHPFRMVVNGPPNSGKSTIVKNLVIRADPPFEKVVIIHVDHGNTQEYKDLGEHGVEMISDIPDPAEWDGEKKTLAVVEDLDLRRLTKQQNKALDRLFGYVSTHKNISVINCGQDFFNAPPIIRRCANVFVIWKSPDQRNMRAIASRVGLPALQELMFSVCPAFHDSLWVDNTENSPYPLRTNGFNLLRAR